MTLTMPQGLQDLASVVVGADFPEGDEDALRRLADAWTACAEEVQGVIGDTDAAAADALSTMIGETADSFQKYADGLTNGDEAPLVELQNLCAQLGEACDNVALEIEYAKGSIIAALVILFAQIAAMLAMAAFTFGASTAGIPIAQAATQGILRAAWAILQQVIIGIIKQLPMQLALNIGINLGVDAAIQVGQMAEGHRTEWDTDKTGAAALSGVAGGLGGAIGGGVFGGVTKGIGGKFGDVLAAGGKGAYGINVGSGIGGGAAGGVIGAGLNNEFQGDEQSDQSLISGAVGGAIGGLGGGIKGIKGDLDNAAGGNSWTEWDGAPPLDTDVTSLIGPEGSGGDRPGGSNGSSAWTEWDGAPPIDSDFSNGGGDRPGGSNGSSAWTEWDGAPPIDSDFSNGGGDRPGGGPDMSDSDILNSGPAWESETRPGGGQPISMPDDLDGGNSAWQTETSPPPTPPLTTPPGFDSSAPEWASEVKPTPTDGLNNPQTEGPSRWQNVPENVANFMADYPPHMVQSNEDSPYDGEEDEIKTGSFEGRLNPPGA